MHFSEKKTPFSIPYPPCGIWLDLRRFHHVNQDAIPKNHGWSPDFCSLTRQVPASRPLSPPDVASSAAAGAIQPEPTRAPLCARRCSAEFASERAFSSASARLN
jgi:hypothetical protein